MSRLLVLIASLLLIPGIAVAGSVDLSGVVQILPGGILCFPDGTCQNTVLNPDAVEWGDISGLIQNQTDLQAQMNTKQDISEKGQPSGYASLDDSGKLPVSQLPHRIYNVQKLTTADFEPVWFQQGDTWTNFDPVYSVGICDIRGSVNLQITLSENVGIAGPAWCNLGIFLDQQQTPFCGGSWSGISGNTVFNQETLVCKKTVNFNGCRIFTVKHRSQYCTYGNYAFDDGGLNRTLTIEEIN